MENKLKVLDYEINRKIINDEDYVSLTDIARKIDPEEPRFVIRNWMRNSDTVDFIGLWEIIYNPNFKRAEFDTFKFLLSAICKICR